jgi:hypothetical protein
MAGYTTVSAEITDDGFEAEQDGATMCATRSLS